MSAILENQKILGIVEILRSPEIVNISKIPRLPKTLTVSMDSKVSKDSKGFENFTFQRFLKISRFRVSRESKDFRISRCHSDSRSSNKSRLYREFRHSRNCTSF